MSPVRRQTRCTPPSRRRSNTQRCGPMQSPFMPTGNSLTTTSWPWCSAIARPTNWRVRSSMAWQLTCSGRIDRPKRIRRVGNCGWSQIGARVFGQPLVPSSGTATTHSSRTRAYLTSSTRWCRATRAIRRPDRHTARRLRAPPKAQPKGCCCLAEPRPNNQPAARGCFHQLSSRRLGLLDG